MPSEFDFEMKFLFFSAYRNIPSDKTETFLLFHGAPHVDDETFLRCYFFDIALRILSNNTICSLLSEVKEYLWDYSFI